MTFETSSITIAYSPVVLWLDQPPDVLKAQTGGRSKAWIFSQRSLGLPIHRRGEGKTARYFLLPEELKRYLLDSSTLLD